MIETKKKNKYIKIGKIGKLTILLLLFSKTDFTFFVVLFVLFSFHSVFFLIEISTFLMQQFQQKTKFVPLIKSKFVLPLPTQKKKTKTKPNHINKCCNCICSIGAQTIHPNTNEFLLN